MNMDSRTLANQGEAKDHRIAQLEIALMELLLEIRKQWNSGHTITAGVSAAYANANTILNTNLK